MHTLIRRFSTAICLVGCLFGSSVFAETINTQDPYELIKQVSNKTFDRFKADKAIIDKDLSHLKVIVDEELIPYVDYKYSAYSNGPIFT